MVTKRKKAACNWLGTAFRFARKRGWRAGNGGPRMRGALCSFRADEGGLPGGATRGRVQGQGGSARRGFPEAFSKTNERRSTTFFFSSETRTFSRRGMSSERTNSQPSSADRV